jgi:hypothetical protein
MRLLVVLAVGLTLAGCAGTYAQTDLVRAERADRNALREATDVAVVWYAPPAPTFSGYVDERSIEIRTQTGIEAPLDRVRDRFVARLARPLGYPVVQRRPPVMVANDSVETLRASVTSPLVLDFRTTSWGVANLRSGGRAGGKPNPEDPIYTHHFVRARLVSLSDGKTLWSAVCGLRGYPGDETVQLQQLTAAGGVVLRQKLAAAADRCADELIEFFQGAE